MHIITHKIDKGFDYDFRAHGVEACDFNLN